MDDRLGNLLIDATPDEFGDAVSELAEMMTDSIEFWIRTRNEGDDAPSETDLSVITTVLDSLVAGHTGGICDILGYPEEVSSKAMERMSGKVYMAVERSYKNAILGYLKGRN